MFFKLNIVLGSSRDLAVGPVSISSLLLGAMLREEISPTKEPVLYLQIAFTATFFAGVFQASLGILRWEILYLIRLDSMTMHPIDNGFLGMNIFVLQQARIYNRLFVTGNSYWIHGRCSN